MSLVKGKYIEDNAINGTRFRLDNNENARARNFANTADINLFKIDTNDRLVFQTLPQVLTDPTSPNDVARKSWVESVAQGLRDPKDAVRLASTANIPLTGGSTLTVDGVIVANGDRILLKNQTTPSQNGIYIVAGIGGAYALTRTTDSDQDAEVTYGLSTWSVEGTENGGTGWLLNTPDPITIGTTSLSFVKVPILNSYVKDVRFKKQLTATDITNGYVDLPNDALLASIQPKVEGAGPMLLTQDFTLSSAAGPVTRLTFVPGAATIGGRLAANDNLEVMYRYTT